MAHTKHDQKIMHVLCQIGLSNANKITKTLQGSIWRASQLKNEATNESKSVVIKVTDKLMHKRKISIIKDKTYAVNEDILLEQSILKYLTESDSCPKSIVKYNRFFKSSSDYYLVMEDGGTPLFDFILKAHELIRSGDIELKQWQKIVQIIYTQMVDCMLYIHSKNICHFDISLENFLINDVAVEVVQCGHSQKIQIQTDDIQIKLCDFGLAKMFTRQECVSNRFCGKTNYRSPESIHRKKGFAAKANDVWCLGVCLFMITFGIAPWTHASRSDDTFCHIMNGKLISLLVEWDILQFANADLVNLFESIFRYEEERISLQKMKKHPYFQFI